MISFHSIDLLILFIFTQHENDDLRAAVDGLAQSVQLLQEEIIENESQRELEMERVRENERELLKKEGEGEGHFVTAPSTPSVCDPASDERRRIDFSEHLSSLSSLAFVDKEIKEIKEVEIDGISGLGSRVEMTPTALLSCLNDTQIEGNHRSSYLGLL